MTTTRPATAEQTTINELTDEVNDLLQRLGRHTALAHAADTDDAVASARWGLEIASLQLGLVARALERRGE